MTIRRYLMKAIQDDAQRAGERGRLLLEAQAEREAAPRAVGSSHPGKASGAAAVQLGPPHTEPGHSCRSRPGHRGSGTRSVPGVLIEELVDIGVVHPGETASRQRGQDVRVRPG
jgi:hypothetical protein